MEGLNQPAQVQTPPPPVQISVVEQTPPSRSFLSKKIILVSGILLLVLAGYIVLIGFPESKKCGAILSCHGIPLNDKCLGYKSIFSYVDCVKTSLSTSPTPIINQTVSIEATQSANWKTDRNDEYGYEMKYPQDWEMYHEIMPPVPPDSGPLSRDSFFNTGTFIIVDKEPYTLGFQGAWGPIRYSSAENAQLIKSENVSINNIIFKKDYWISRSAGDTKILTAVSFYAIKNGNYYTVSRGLDISSNLKSFYPDRNFSEKNVLGSEIKDKELIKQVFDKMRADEKMILLNQILFTFKFLDQNTNNENRVCGGPVLEPCPSGYTCKTTAIKSGNVEETSGVCTKQ